MAIEEQIRAKLIADSGLTALVAERIYPNERVPSTSVFPRIVYMVISEFAMQQLDGISKQVSAKWQFDCLANDYTSAKVIARKVRDILCVINGDVGGGIKVRGCINPNIFDGNDLPVDGASVGISRIVIEIEIVYEEA